LVGDFELANRLINNAEYLEFIQDGGYRQPVLWLSDGWSTVQQENWQAPLYWVQHDGVWHEFGLDGLQPLDPSAPVSHISLYEADAFSSWAGARLPSEVEWEVSAGDQAITGNFVESGSLTPLAPAPGTGLLQLFGDLWEWTRSAYQPYPGFQAAAGPLGEYNGKFMCNQMVMRGGSCVTAAKHVRASYRNFFYPHMRWQYAGLRLARDINPAPK
jgi:ergothioneine biosynthesis protein EgtB